MKKFFGELVVYVTVFMSTGAISGIYSAQEALKSGTTAAASNPVLELMYGSLYLILIAFLMTERHRALSLILREKWMALFILFAMASTFWSISPEDTFRRSLGLLATTLAGLYIGMHFEPREQIRIVATCIGIAAALSIVAGIADPHIALTPDGYLQGVFFQKNTLGRIMCLGIVCLSIIAIGQRRYRMAALVMIPLCAVLLGLTGSVTAIVATVVLLSLLPFTRILQWPSRRLAAVGIVGAAVALPAGVWLVNNVDAILKAVGKSSTLTGRLPLWHLVWTEIQTKPVLGDGYTAFWSTADADRFRQALNWDVMNAHNLFLEMMLGLGFVGLIIFVVGLLRNLVLAFRIARAGEEIEQAWPLFFLLFCVLWNVTDSTLFINNSVFWLLYTANAFWLVETNAVAKAEVPEDFLLQEQVGEFARS